MLALACVQGCVEPPPAGCDARRDGVAILQLGTAAEDVATAVAVDARCEVVVLGMTTGALGAGEDRDGAVADWFVARWKADGERVLLRQLGTAYADDAEAVAVDADGAVIAVGGAPPGPATADSAPGNDLLVLKLDLAGDEAWRVTRGDPQREDLARGVAVDASGKIHVTGMTNEAAERGTELFLLELGEHGTGAVMTFAGTAEGEAPHDLGQALGLDAEGEVVLGGASLGPYGGAPQGSFDVVVTRLRADRSEAWVQRRGTGDIDATLDLVVDAEGNSYVAAVSYADLLEPALEGDGAPSAFLLKYARDGALRWGRRLGSVGAFTRIQALALAPDGGVFAAGVTEEQLGAAHAGGRDAFVARFDADGELRWTEQLGTAAADEAQGVAVDPRGQVILVGSTTGALGAPGHAGGTDAFVAWIDAR